MVALYHGRGCSLSVPGGIGGTVAFTEPAPVVLPGARFVLVRTLAELPVEQLSDDLMPGSGTIILIGRALVYVQANADGLEPQAGS